MPLSSFRQSLRDARRAKNWTEAQAAEAVGVSISAWRSYERQNGRAPPLARLGAITRALGPGPVNALLAESGHVCERHGSRDDLIRRWIKLGEDFLVDARKLVGE
jgi:transcriptional regulator with XRE-family HTH domain